jgi:hypothetical protein
MTKITNQIRWGIFTQQPTHQIFLFFLSFSFPISHLSHDNVLISLIWMIFYKKII